MLGFLVIFSPIKSQSDSFSPTADNETCKNIVTHYRPDLASTTDTVECFRWIEEEWVLNYLYINTYDDAGRLTETITKFLNLTEQEWTSLLRNSYTYYDNDSIKSILDELWNPELDGGTWDNSSYDEYEYDDQNRLVFSLTHFSPYGSHELNPGNRSFYSYNGYSLMDTVITQYWNTIEEEWFYSYRMRYYYDEDMHPAENYRDWANNQTGEYALYERVVFTRNDSMQTVDAVTQNYYDGQWDNYWRDHISLNGMDLPESVLFQQWIPDQMMWDTAVMERWLYAYNEAGQMTEYTSQSYYIMWENTQRQAYTYDENYTMIESLSQQWDSFNKEWQNIQHCFYPIQVISSFPENLSGMSKTIKLKPNPAKNYVVIEFEDSASESFVLSIFNSAGQQVKKIMAIHGETLDLGDLKPGLYFAQAEGQNQVSKLIIR